MEATIASHEEILEIDLEEIKNSQPVAAMSEKVLREEVDELRARIREDFPDDSEFGFVEGEIIEEDQQVEEPDEDAVKVSVSERTNEQVELESVYSEHQDDSEDPEPAEIEDVETGEADQQKDQPNLVGPDSPGSLLDVSEAVSETENATTSKRVFVDVLDDSDNKENNAADPNTIKSYFSVPVTIYLPNAQDPVLLYGENGVVTKAPNKDVSLEQIFETLRNHFTDIPTEKELYLCMPQLDLQLGEDNIYCNDTTLVDLLRLLDTCDEHPDSLQVKLEYRDRFISKLNALFDILNDLPPAKRRRASLDDE